MQIVFINNDGSGFADKLEIAEGVTVGQLFVEKMPYAKAQNYLIRVNRQPTTSDYVLQPGDRISITPTKIEGAALRPSCLRTRSPVLNQKGTAWEPGIGSIICI